MKNKQAAILILITCVFAAFTLGFLTGRITGAGDILISPLPAATQPTASPSANITRFDPSLDTAVSTEGSTSDTADQAGLININTASLALLDSLPGIGPVLAQRIIDYRQAHGPFTDVSQLLLVEGIGDKRLANILHLITV